MRTPGAKVIQWKRGVLPAVAILLVSLIPQIHFWLVRGSQWHGTYAMQQGDESYYSAYINALMDGRPRRNDPAAGQDDVPQSPLPESLFSIQFIPSYVIAFFGRAFGLSASTSFVVLMGAAALLAGLAVFWLLASVTRDGKFAAAGVLVVLCLGALAAGQGWIGIILRPGARFSGLPFLRRYLPAAPFPLFFVFCTLIYGALTAQLKRTAIVKAVLGGMTLGVLIFSYFYLWTAALAWLVCVVLLWLFVRPYERRNAICVCILTGVAVIPAFAFYGYLISHIPPALDKAQVLILTHRPDLLRIPEFIGALVLLVLLMRLRRDRVLMKDPVVIFVAAFALLPFLVFNQQIITGRSIQPYHYEIFVANYSVLIGLVLVAKLLRQPGSFSRRTLVLTTCVCLLWGAIEVNQPFKERSTFDVANDEMVPVLLRLKEMAKHDGTWEGLHQNGKTPALVFSPQSGISRMLPTWAPQGSLLAAGSAPFQSLPQSQRKEWLYLHFYYCGRNPEYLGDVLNDHIDDLFLTYFAKSTLFGPERVLPFLAQDFQPISHDEIDHEVRAYGSFVDSLSREQILKRPVTYAVTVADSNFDFTNLDRWYARDSGERVGAYKVYRLKLRD
jgi:hypothetical protein